jgi:hypothetical protein
VQLLTGADGTLTVSLRKAPDTRACDLVFLRQDNTKCRPEVILIAMRRSECSEIRLPRMHNGRLCRRRALRHRINNIAGRQRPCETKTVEEATRAPVA